jgi:hypothetical protein
MLKLLQEWDKWRKAVITGREVWLVISAFIRKGKVQRMTLKREDKREYREATPEEIERITE